MTHPEPCQCQVAGYCDRHKLTKNEHWHKLCQRKEVYRQAWDEGYGPGQPSRGLGDTIAKATTALNIKKCGGCDGRQEWLNKAVPYKKQEDNTVKCSKCGKPSTRICSHTLAMAMCGAPLCEECSCQHSL